MDLIWGRKTEAWFVGACKNNNIYILNPNVYEKESSHKKEEFWQILKHEYCHIYYTQITKCHYPFWLNEGLAGYLSGKKLVLKNEHKGKLLNIFSYYDKVDSNVYLVGQLVGVEDQYFVFREGSLDQTRQLGIELIQEPTIWDLDANMLELSKPVL